MSEIVGDPDYDRGGCLCYLRRAPHHLGQSHSHHGRATHGVFSYDELLNYVNNNKKQQNAQKQFIKCAPWKVHFEPHGKKDRETKKGKSEKKQNKKEQRKILTQNSCLAKFIITVKDVLRARET